MYENNTGDSMHRVFKSFFYIPQMLVSLMGVLLFGWGALKARNRSVLVATLTLLLAVGGGVVAFAEYPEAFDSLSFLLRIPILRSSTS